MAAEKRALESDKTDQGLLKKLRSDGSHEKMAKFLVWCTSGKLVLNQKVKIDTEGSCAQYGMVAVSDVERGETLFKVPRKLLLSQESCSIGQLLKNEADSVKSESGWVPLLLALLHEYTKADSFWEPYLKCYPDFDELDLPLLWPPDELNIELRGTGVIEAVNRDLKGITHEFKNIVVPFMKKHSNLFPPECHDLGLYKKMVAFVMAYSFTEPVQQEDDDEDDFDYEMKSPPMMVPMADALNHVAKNNAKLKFGKDSLKMVACQAIKQGEEVFNTYGELANWQLLHMYGFAETYPNNHFDTVEISMPTAYSAIRRSKSGSDEKLVKEKWNFLKSADIVTDDGAFVLGCDGFLTEEETLHTLKVLCMSSSEFEEHLENEGWVEDEEDDVEESLTFNLIPKLPTEKRDILKAMGEECLRAFSTTLQEEEGKLQGELTRRQRHCAHVRYGQLKLLHKLIDSCSLTTGSDSSAAVPDPGISSTKSLEETVATQENSC